MTPLFRQFSGMRKGDTSPWLSFFPSCLFVEVLYILIQMNIKDDGISLLLTGDDQDIEVLIQVLLCKGYTGSVLNNVKGTTPLEVINGQTD